MVHNMEFGPDIKHIGSYISLSRHWITNLNQSQIQNNIITLMGQFLIKTSITLNIFHVKHILWNPILHSHFTLFLITILRIIIFLKMLPKI